MANIIDSDFSHDFIVEDSAGAVQDVSTWTFEVQWFRQGESAYTFKLTDAITFVASGTDGHCRNSLTAAQTKTLGPGVARLVIWRTDSGNRVVIGEGSAPFESLNFDG